MSTTDQRPPDIEIYIRSCSIETIQQWLSHAFDEVSPLVNLSPSTFEADCGLANQRCQILIHEKAAGKQYTSVWFKQNHTPWIDDLACAQSAAAHMKTEVRCANGGWQEGANEDESWWKVTEEGQTLTAWR